MALRLATADAPLQVCRCRVTQTEPDVGGGCSASGIVHCRRQQRESARVRDNACVMRGPAWKIRARRARSLIAFHLRVLAMRVAFAGLLGFSQVTSFRPIDRLGCIPSSRVNFAAFNEAPLGLIVLPGDGLIAFPFIFLKLSLKNLLWLGSVTRAVSVRIGSPNPL